MSMRKTSRKNKRQSRESGQAAVFLVLAMGLFLIGSMGFVVDGANLWFHRQSAQTAADAACTAGAMNMLSVAAGATPPSQNWIGISFQCSGSTGSGNNQVPNSGFVPCQYAAFNGYTSSGLQANHAGTDVSVTFPGSFSSIPSCSGGSTLCTAKDVAAQPYMQVNITDRVQTTFIGMLNGGHTVDVGAQAICGLSNVLSPVPVLVLNPSASNAMTGSNFSLTVTNSAEKGIQVNSTDPGAVSVSGPVNLTNSNGGLADFSVAARENVSDSGVTTLTGKWVSPAGVITDPFASVPPPSRPTAVGYYDPGTCPADLGILPANCAHFHPGYYPTGIQLNGGSAGPGSNVIAVFEPGIYYLDGDFVANPNTCLRPDTTGSNIQGTVFYFHGTSTLTIHSSSGTASSGTFNCATTPVPISALQCTGSTNRLLSSLPVTGLTGNVLLGPCGAPATDPLHPYGDPLGSLDPAGEQRGIVFFHDRDSQPTSQLRWHASGSSGLIGSVYFHYCDSTSSTGTGSGVNCNSTAFADVFSPGSGANSYIVGAVVVDQLQLGQPSGTSRITVSLNPYAQYYTLKASLLQ
ncbi:MAG: hypothetical protein JWN74_704 [Acidobacteriaceae bacterium]|nr:hypothetical protein [Acidobacteriaceae bacterium]